MLPIILVCFIHTSLNVLQQFLNPSNTTNSITFIIYTVAMLKVVIILSVYTHTDQNAIIQCDKMVLFMGRHHRPNTYYKISDVSHTRIYEHLEMLIVLDVPFCYGW